MTAKIHIYAPVIGTEKAEYLIHTTGIRRDVPVLGEDPFRALLKSKYDRTMEMCVRAGLGTQTWHVRRESFIKLLVAMEKTITKFGGEMYVSEGDKRYTIRGYFRFNYSLRRRG